MYYEHLDYGNRNVAENTLALRAQRYHVTKIRLTKCVHLDLPKRSNSTDAIEEDRHPTMPGRNWEPMVQNRWTTDRDGIAGGITGATTAAGATDTLAKSGAALRTTGRLDGDACNSSSQSSSPESRCLGAGEGR
jgi:hypothetical protein